MPFTLAHPAAAIPLLRPLGRYGVLSALVIGGMAPDLAFVVGLPATREQTHSLAGMLMFSLPAGALAFLLFHLLLKAPLCALLPASIRLRLPEHSNKPAAFAVVVSLAAGATTHIIWDAFTHPGTPATDAFPILHTHLANLGGYQVYVYKVLQHGGTVAGLALMAHWLRRWLARTPAAKAQFQALPLPRRVRAAVIAALLALPTAVGGGAAFTQAPAVANILSAQAFATAFVFAFLPALTLTLVAYGVAWRVLHRPPARS